MGSQFDKNGGGHIDDSEFKALVYRSLLLFCKERNPDLPPPGRANMDPFIKKLVKELRPYVDEDKNMQISRKEFKNFGVYLTKEFKKLKLELEPKKPEAAGGGDKASDELHE